MDTEVAGSPTQRLLALLTGRVKRNAERRFANRVCDEALAALQYVRTAHPELHGDELYEAVVARRGNLDAGRARAIVQRAAASLEDWGNDREAKFIDVVKYLIVSEYLEQKTREEGITIDLGALLTPRIDPLL